MGLELARAYITVRGDSSRLQKDFAAMKGPVVAQTSRIGTAMGRVLSTAMMAGGVAGFAGIFAMATREVVGFERKMIDVRANARLLGEEGEEAFQLLNATARELGATTQFTAKQSAEALDWMVLGGLKAREAVEAVPSVLALASSANLELAESAKIVIDNMRKYGMEASETGKIADFMSSAQSRAQITARDLAQGLQSLGSITTSMNVSFQDTVALLTGMGRAGTEMSRGGTALSMALFRLAAPPKEAEEALRKMNIQVKSFVDKESGVLNLIGLFKAVALAMPTDPIERGAAAGALFGMRAREILGVLRLLRDTTFVEETQVGLMEDMGRAARVSEAKLETFWGMLKKVRSVLGELAIAGLTPVLKSLQPLLENIRAGTAMFAKFVTWVYKVGDAIGNTPFGYLLSGFWQSVKVGGVLTGVLISMQFAVAKLSLAFTTLGGSAGAALLVLGRWKIALVALVALMDTVMVHSIAFGAIGLKAIVAHPIVAFFAALAAGIGVVILEWRKVNQLVEEGNKITAQFVERGKEQEKTLIKQVTRLQELANAGGLNNKQAKEAQEIIDELESRYGSLGLQVDQATGSIIGMEKALDQLARQSHRIRAAGLRVYLADLTRQYGEAKEKSLEFFRVQGHWMGEMDRLNKEMVKTQKELFALWEKPIKFPSIGIEGGDERNADASRENAREIAKAAFDMKRELVLGIGELDFTTVRNEFNLLRDQVSAIVREFPELENAAKRFLELEWEETPFGKVTSQLEDALFKTKALSKGWESWRIELEKFARQEWVSPAQVEMMRRMLVMQDRLQKKRTEESRFKDMAKSIREEMRTPVDKMLRFVFDIKKLAERGRQGLPGGLSPVEAMRRLQMERQRVQEGRPKEDIRIEAGRFGFADYGKSLQDAFMKSNDPAKMTAKNTAEANKMLILINQGIQALAASPSPTAVYAR